MYDMGRFKIHTSTEPPPNRASMTSETEQLRKIFF